MSLFSKDLREHLQIRFGSMVLWLKMCRSSRLVQQNSRLRVFGIFVQGLPTTQLDVHGVAWSVPTMKAPLQCVWPSWIKTLAIWMRWHRQDFVAIKSPESLASSGHRRPQVALKLVTEGESVVAESSEFVDGASTL